MMKSAYKNAQGLTRSAHGYIVMASFEALQNIVEEKQAVAFVWPDEGEQTIDRWRFNKDHKGFEPLLVDLTTAHMMLTVYKAINDSNKAKFSEWIGKSRGHFAKIHEISMKAFA